MTLPTIAIDVMSSDASVDELIKGCQLFLDEYCANIDIFGDEKYILSALKNYQLSDKLNRTIRVFPTSEIVLQDDNPLSALRHKRQSSTHLAIKHVADKSADAVVSCANTGAYVAISRYLLKLVPSVERMALMGSFPTHAKDTDVYIADIGATVDATPEHLLQYAKMGQAFLAKDKKTIRVGLLSNGTEKIKGNMLTKTAHDYLANDPEIDYKGFVEGHMLFSGDYDLVVCDGFVGNAVLKACEGAAYFIQSTIKNALKASVVGQTIAYPLKMVLDNYGPKLQPQKRNGGILLGVQGVVVKSHGNSDAKSFANALKIAYESTLYQVIEKMCHSLKEEVAG